MSTTDLPPKLPSAAPERRTPAYEPPRIVSKRSVEGVTLLSQTIPGPPGSQGGIGGE